MAPSLSFCCLSGGPAGADGRARRARAPRRRRGRGRARRAGRPAARSGRCRSSATSSSATRSPSRSTAPLAWLHGLCRCDWILRLDDDEVPSAGAARAVRAWSQRRELTHAHVPRRWLHPDASTWLADAPWTPDYQLRLVRNDPTVVSFPGWMHVADRRGRAGGVARRAALPPRPDRERPRGARGEGAPLRARLARAARRRGGR